MDYLLAFFTGLSNISTAIPDNDTIEILDVQGDDAVVVNSAEAQ